MLRILASLIVMLCGTISFAGGINDELQTASKYLETIDEDDRQYIRFFTTYTIPERLRDNAVLSLSFWIHSLTGIPADQTGNLGYFRPLAVAMNVGTEKAPVYEFEGLHQVSETLWWVDLRDYNWTENSFETVSVADPYVRKPWVNEDYDKIRLIAGNAVLRADWFLMHTCDTTRQVDYDKQPLYYNLLYAQQKIPTTAEEYRQIWGIDVARAEKFGLARGGVVDQGKSIVSRHTRELTGIRTDIGYHWESSDYKNTENINDALENLSIERNANGVPIHKGLARKADAHEYITTNLLGLQVYFLTNGSGQRIEFADSTIVVDNSDQTGDVRVRTSRSCVICHAVGINPIKNELIQAVSQDIDLITTYKDYQQAVERYYFSNLSIKEADDQAIFTRAVNECNGLSPLDNNKNFQTILDWYDEPVTLEQAALECGTTVQNFKEKLSRSTSVRLLRLVEGQTIPRQLWEIPNTGFYSQAMLILTGLQLESKEPVESPEEKPLTENMPKIRVLVDTDCKVGTEVIGRVTTGMELEYSALNGNWYQITLDGKKCFIHKDKVEQL